MLVLLLQTHVARSYHEGCLYQGCLSGMRVGALQLVDRLQRLVNLLSWTVDKVRTLFRAKHRSLFGQTFLPNLEAGT